MVMKQRVIKDHRELFKSERALVACIGYFDGIHLGHQKLINKTIDIAKEKGINSALITFDPDPWTVFNDRNKVNHITPMKEKIRLLSNTGLDELIIVQFTKDLSKLSPQDFIEKILIPLNVVDLVAGEDFKFGHMGKGNIEYLKNNAAVFFDTHALKFEETKETKIGSTKITQAILKGDCDQVEAMLGRPYTIAGYVMEGNREGTRIGYPTANLEVTDEYIIPKRGVYAGYVEVKGEQYKSVLNIGYNPTFNQSESLSIETHILDFNKIIYGELLKQSFVIRLRDELKFDSVDELVDQMAEDELLARKILK